MLERKICKSIFIISCSILSFADVLLSFLLSQAALNFERIFYIAGNHEYYGGNYDKGMKALEDFAKTHPKLTFLQKSSFLLEGNQKKTLFFQKIYIYILNFLFEKVFGFLRRLCGRLLQPTLPKK